MSSSSPDTGGLANCHRHRDEDNTNGNPRVVHQPQRTDQQPADLLRSCHGHKVDAAMVVRDNAAYPASAVLRPKSSGALGTTVGGARDPTLVLRARKPTRRLRQKVELESV